MKITVFGLGYVGSVTAACLAERGHSVTGVDIDETKVAMINAGKSPIIEAGLEPLIRRGVEAGKLRACTTAGDLGHVALVCVGTPSHENGSLDLSQMLRVSEVIAQLLKSTTEYVVIGIRSTVLPGTVEERIIPLLEGASGKMCGAEFGVCMNPEFMRETTAVSDFDSPPFTIVGSSDGRAAARINEMYSGVGAPVEHTSIREAEMVKYACNAFHAVKVCFANEIGNVSKRLGVDSHRVMSILCRDTKLNLSAYYLKPGFAFGGSCLPKDLRAVLHRARQVDVEMPMLRSTLDSNRQQIDIAFQMVHRTGRNRVGVLGLSFKGGTDDVRESPIVALTELLLGKGYEVRIFDEEVALAKLYGANRRYIETAIPHISSLMCESIEDVVVGSEVVVVAKGSREFSEAVERWAGDRVVLDLVRLWAEPRGKVEGYEGICW
jgi:GDP-mannose 6-dehydrogenase